MQDTITYHISLDCWLVTGGWDGKQKNWNDYFALQEFEKYVDGDEEMTERTGTRVNVGSCLLGSGSRK
jgi:hypothetical protein